LKLSGSETKTLDDLRSKVKHSSPDAIARRLEKFKVVRARARIYAMLLRLQQETIAHSSTIARARHAVAAIAGLIDDDGDAPF